MKQMRLLNLLLNVDIVYFKVNHGLKIQIIHIMLQHVKQPNTFTKLILI